MSDTVTQVLKRIAIAQGATVNPTDTKTRLVKKIYAELTGSQTSRRTFNEISKQIAIVLGADITNSESTGGAWRAICVKSGGTPNQVETLLGLLLGTETAKIDAAIILTLTVVSNDEITLAWGAVPLAITYEVERSTDNSTWTTLSISETGTSYSSTGLTTGTTYYYRVRAKTPDGYTAWATESATTISEEGSYTLSADSITSAGIFDENDVLIRTLWSNIEKSAGTHSLGWDGLDNEGLDPGAGVYHAKVLAWPDTLVPTWDGVACNTSDNQTGSDKHMGYVFYQGMAVVPGGASAGRIFWAHGYVEGLQSFSYSSQSGYQSRTPFSHLDYKRSWRHVCVDADHMYASNNGHGLTEETEQSFIVRFSVGSPEDYSAGFSSGTDISPGDNGYRWDGAIDLGDLYPNGPSGIAVQQSGSYLFVAFENTDTISVFNKTTGSLVSSFAVSAPTRLAVDDNDHLWVISGGDTAYRYTSFSGTPTPAATISGLDDALAIAGDLNGIIAIIEGGTTQQVTAYNLSGVSQWVIGQAGGYINDPTAADDKFDFGSGQPFVGFSPNGNIWIGDTGCDRIQIFDTATQSHQDTIQWLHTTYVSTVDLNDPTRVFARWLEFEIDYTEAIADCWTFTANWRPSAPATMQSAPATAGGLATVLTLTDGDTRTFAVVHDTAYALDYQKRIIEMTSSGVRDTGLHLPAPSRRCQWFADGSIIRVAYSEYADWRIYRSTFSGFDVSNNPTFSAESLYASAPKGANDPAYLGHLAGPGMRYGWMSDGRIVSLNGDINSSRKYRLGAVAAGGSDWQFRALPIGRWTYGPPGDRQITGPFNSDDGGPAWDDAAAGGQEGTTYAGNRVIGIQSDSLLVAGYHGEFWRAGQANQWFLYHESGLFVAQFGKVNYPYEITLALPERTGNGFSGAMCRANGSLYLWHNDEWPHSGLHRWSFPDDDQLLVDVVELGEPNAPLAPSGLTATANGLEIDLAWTDNSDDESGFKIERKTGDGSWAQIDTVSADETTYTDDSSLDPETEYFYRIRAYNVSGESSYSNEDSDTTGSAASIEIGTPVDTSATGTTPQYSNYSSSGDPILGFITNEDIAIPDITALSHDGTVETDFSEIIDFRNASDNRQGIWLWWNTAPNASVGNITGSWTGAKYIAAYVEISGLDTTATVGDGILTDTNSVADGSNLDLSITAPGDGLILIVQNDGSGNISMACDNDAITLNTAFNLTASHKQSVYYKEVSAGTHNFTLTTAGTVRHTAVSVFIPKA